MQFKTSSCKKALALQNLRRFWPIAAAYAAIWLLAALPALLHTISRGGAGASDLVIFFLGGTQVASLCNFCFAIIAACAMFSYLHSRRAIDSFHSIPATRSTLFFVNAVCGFLPFIIANLVVLLICGCFILPYGATALGGVLLAFLLNTAELVCFYGIALFCVMCTGTFAMAPTLYFILNFLGLGISWLLDQLGILLIYGYVSTGINHWFAYASPLYGFTSGSNYFGWAGSWLQWWLIAIYAAVGLAFGALAYALYRRRRSEDTGEVISEPVLRPVFKYAMATGFAAVLGIMLCAIFGLLSQTQVHTTSLWGILVCFLASGALGYYIALMLLERRLRVFRKGLIGLVSFCLAATLVIGALWFDVFGLASGIPNSAEVQFANFNNATIGSPLDPDAQDQLKGLTQLNQAVVDQRYENIEQLQQCDAYAIAFFTYHLSGGAIVQREYRIPVSYQEGSAYQQYTAFLQQPEVARAILLGPYVELPQNATCNGAVYVDQADTLDGDDQSLVLSQKQVHEVYKTLLQDIEDGLYNDYLIQRSTYPVYADSTETSYPVRVTLTVEFFPSLTSPHGNEADAEQAEELSIWIPVIYCSSATGRLLVSYGLSPQSFQIMTTPEGTTEMEAIK